jgi:hypothetical protein
MMMRTFYKIAAIFCILVIPYLAIPAVEKKQAPSGQGADRPVIRVGVYKGNGASPACVTETFEALRIDGGIEPLLIGPIDIYTGGLDELDVIVFPGGSGSTQNNSLGGASHEKIVRFVREKGKGVVGICAGGYLVSSSEEYPCLGLIGADTIDREHDKRGSALVQVTFAEKGLEIFPEMKGYRHGYIQYHDGPVFVPPPGGRDTACDELAVNDSDVHHTGNAPEGITPGKSFLLCEEVGKGRVFACAGHPESTTGMRWMVPRMVRWAARKELVGYPADITRPGLGDAEIMHSDELETELFWKLFDDDAAIRIEALSELNTKRYRNGSRWAVGMLRDTSPDVRAFAARVLAEEEYTAAIDDLEAAIREERVEPCREQLQRSLSALQRMIAR